MTETLPSTIRDRRDIEALLARATNYEELRPRSPVQPEFKLDRVRALLASVGDPHLRARTVHVAGSKGKGSVARMVDAVLRRTGRGPVGLYTSPHLEDLTERAAVDGRPASEAEWARAADRLLPHLRRAIGTRDAATFFEIVTAIAWLVFAERGCTDVVLEVGLGGRLDATNVCAPAATVITTIELEHTDVLGPTIASVAGEKAGILKAGVPAATGARGEALATIRARAAAVGAPLAELGRDVVLRHAATGPGPRTDVRLAFPGGGADLAIALPVAGVHQAANAALAAWVARVLGVPDATTLAALAVLRLPGILEPLGGDPLVVADGAHTPVSAAASRAAADACWPGRRRVLLLAFLEGKDVEAIGAALFPGSAAAVVTRLATPRARDPEDVARLLAGGASGAGVEVVPDPAAALDRARALAGPGGLVLATGSVRVAGLVRSLVRSAAGP